MGQVPTSYGIVGSGNVARHIGRYFQLKDIPYKTASRSTCPSGLDFGRFVRRELSDVSALLILVSDEAIEHVIREIEPQSNQIVIHFSGALVTPLAQGWHPLMTFSGEPYDRKTYESIGFVGELGRPSFKSVFPELVNPSIQIPAHDKPLYHALCVSSGNFTNILWNTFFRELQERWQIPKSFGITYLDKITEILKQNSQKQSGLTGPIARGDVATLEKNIDALSGHELQEIYLAFVRTFAPHLNLRGFHDNT